MKKLLTSISKRSKIVVTSAMTFVATILNSVTAFATSPTPALDLPDIGATMIGDVMRWLFQAIGWLGIPVFGLGALFFILSLNSQDPQQKSKGMMFALIGVGMGAIGFAVAAMI